MSVVKCENECASRVGRVVLPCTLEQWVNSPPPIPVGMCAEFDGIQTIQDLGSGYIILPQPTGSINDPTT